MAVAAADLQRIALERRAKVEEFQQRHRVGLLTLVFTDVVDSTKLKQTVGEREGVAAIERHHAAIREVLGQFNEGEEIETAGDSFFIVFTKPSDAVKFSLLVQARLRELAAEAGRLVLDRIGIHVGEVWIRENDGSGKARDLYGIQVDTCARVQSLGEADQILLTRFPFDAARQALRGEELKDIGALSWLNHGPYVLKGVEEPLEICEVGELGRAKLIQPVNTEKAYRFISPDSEPVLGWRPAVEQPVPGTGWVLEKKLGEGGFGEVWLGRDKRLKTQHVFKFCFRADRVRSLKREVTLFRLLKERIGEHPNIVGIEHVYFDEAPFYIVMQHVEGQDLSTWCVSQGGVDKVPLTARIEIVAQVAGALQAAHDSGVIHRDVKPSNILVGGQSDIHAYLTDFGIGQVVSEEVLSRLTHSGFTQTMVESSSRSGTQLYMAPELFSGKPASIRSDIYALGVVLYQLLIGDFSRAVTTDWAKQIGDPLLQEDLEKCFAGDPQERFAGAGQLAEQLRSLEERRAASDKQQALLKERERAAYRRGILRTAALALVVIGLVSALAIYAFLQRHEAQEKTQEASAQRQAAIAARVDAEKQKQGAVTANANLEAKNRELGSLLEEAARSDWLVAEEKLRQGEVGEALSYLARASRYTPKSLFPAQTAITAVLASPIAHSQVIFQGHTAAVYQAVFSPDGRRVLTASADKSARLWEAESGKLLGIFQGHTDKIYRAVFSPDGRRVLTASSDNTARLWEADGGKLLATFQGHTGRVQSAVFSPDGRRVLTGSGDNTARLWEAESGELLTTFQGHTGTVYSAVFSPDGLRVLTASGDSTARLWEAGSGKLLASFQGHTGEVYSAIFSSDGLRMVTASEDKSARLWAVENGELLAILQGHTATVSSAVFSPDGRRVLTASWDATARLWDADSGRPLAVFQGRDGMVYSAVFSPDGLRVLTASADTTARLWDAENRKLLVTFQGGDSVFSAVFSPDGRRILTASADKSARLWAAESGKLLAAFQGHTGGVLSAVFSPDERRVLTTSEDRSARLWAAESGKLLAIFQGRRGWFPHAVFSPDGRRVLTASEDENARLWTAQSGKLLTTFQGHTGEVQTAVFSPDGLKVLTASDDRSARLWEAESGKLLTTFQGHTDVVYSAVFSADGLRVLTASKDKSARLWEADSGKPLVTFEGHNTPVYSAIFSPDGRRVLTASADSTARLWEAGSGKLLTTFPGRNGWSLHPVFSPDGRRVLTVPEDESAQLWEAASGKVLATFQGHTGLISSAVFSPDGLRVLTASWDTTSRLWEAESGKVLATLQDDTDKISSAVFSPDGRRVLVASHDKVARLWPVLPAGVPPPEWCGDFLVWLGGKRIAPDGQIETLSGDELRQLEAQLRPHMNEDTDYARLLRWRLSTAEERPVDPYDTITQQEAADLIIRPDMNQYETGHAYDLDPWHPLIHLAIAGFEEDPIRADFLRRYALDRLPNDARIRQRAAEFLRKQGKEDLAREVEVRGDK
jgi:WD40 repeat protein/class 3 adenylate cyclase/tRNA A-37 threonylcarbamoyl transferase component Bud32